MVLRTIGRLIWVTLAAVVAAAVGLFVLITLGLEKFTVALHGSEPGPDTLEAMLTLLADGTLLLSGLTVLPALAAILIGEIGRLRSWLYYTLAGGATFVAVPVLSGLGAQAASAPSVALWQVFATAGFAAGFVYWLLAGRSA